MSSNSTPRRASKQSTASTAPPLIAQHQYYSPLSLSPQSAYQFQAPQPFPNFQPPQQLHQHQQIQPHQQLQHQHPSPYAPQHPPQQQLAQHSMPQPPSMTPQLPSQNQNTSPPSRKRKQPGGVPSSSPSISSMPPQIGPGAPQIPGDPSSHAPIQGKIDEGGDESTQIPPPKKSRTNTPWSPAEENLLRRLRDQGKSWNDIAKHFPARTEGSVKKHWYKDMHYAEFAEDESQALLNAIKEYEQNKWKFIGAKVGKPAKACEQYAKAHFGERI